MSFSLFQERLRSTRPRSLKASALEGRSEEQHVKGELGTQGNDKATYSLQSLGDRVSGSFCSGL